MISLTRMTSASVKRRRLPHFKQSACSSIRARNARMPMPMEAATSVSAQVGGSGAIALPSPHRGEEV